jgi:SEC-C motif-containing protein
MRARYAAFALAKIDYLCDTLPVKERKSFDRKGVTEWATGSEWKKLEIHKTEGGQAGDDKGVVEFTATFVNGGNEVNHREKSIFQLDKGEGRWVLVKSVTNEPVRAEALPGRNEPCHCGSGKKFKKCHGAAA